jgi:hypothetical protein
MAMRGTTSLTSKPAKPDRAAAFVPSCTGFTAPRVYHLQLGAGESAEVRLRFTDTPPEIGTGSDFDRICQARADEADEFYATVIPRRSRTMQSR